MTPPHWVWRPPPSWPQPPPGWSPPPGWRPPPEWPAPPPGWNFWTAVPASAAAPPAPAPPVPLVRVEAPSRRSLVWETRFVLLAFLVPGVTSALIVLVRFVQGVSGNNQFTTAVPGHPLSNLLLGIISYFSIAAMVPLTLLLLVRTGQHPGTIGLGVPRWWTDIWPGLGLAAASWLSEYVLLIPLTGLIGAHSKLINTTSTTHLPAYYVAYALTTSATTAIAEEVVVNGYLLTRLEQLGWTPQRALVLSLVLRTSYHVYYGVGVILTVPFGYFVTRSFQKHRRLNRAIAAHFIFDAVLTTVAVLTS